MKRYYLRINIGKHEMSIKTNKKDFEKWIDRLSTEFEIIKNVNYKTETYEIINYYGELMVIGYICNKKEDNLPY